VCCISSLYADFITLKNAIQTSQFLPLFFNLRYNDGDMSPELQTFFLSMTPIFEGRTVIPIAMLVYQMNPLSAYFWAILGNIIPIFVILIFLEPVSLWLSKHFSFMEKFFNFLFERTRKNYDERVKKYGYLALAIFTAIPLPITGAWTASLAAFLFGLSYVKSVIAIICGVLLAGVFVYFIIQTGVAIESYYGPQIVLGVILLALLIYFIRSKKKKNV
jgi:uncharacterized membrane protein